MWRRELTEDEAEILRHMQANQCTCTNGTYFDPPEIDYDCPQHGYWDYPTPDEHEEAAA